MPKHIALALYRRRWTEADAREVLAAADESGLSISAFAIKEGLDAQRLYWWRHRLAVASKGDTATPAFVELTADALRSEHIEVVLRSGRILRFSSNIDTTVLRRLVTALEQEAC